MGFRGAPVDLGPVPLADIAMGRTDTNRSMALRCRRRVLPDERHGGMIQVSALEQVQSEMLIWTAHSEVPAARGPSFDDSAEPEHSDWLKERSNPS
jgi:hypothetical protein